MKIIVETNRSFEEFEDADDALVMTSHPTLKVETQTRVVFFAPGQWQRVEAVTGS